MQSIRVLKPSVLSSTVREETVLVHSEHEAPVRQYYRAVRQDGPFALRLLAGVSVVGAVLSFGTAFVLPVVSGIMGALLLMTIGAVILRFPFSTPETIQLFGLRRSLTITRISGIVCLLLGLGLGGSMLWMS